MVKSIGTPGHYKMSWHACTLGDLLPILTPVDFKWHVIKVPVRVMARYPNSFVPIVYFFHVVQVQTRWHSVPLLWESYCLNVASVLYKSLTLSPAKQPHTISVPPPCLIVGTTLREIGQSFSCSCLWNTRQLEPKIYNLDSSDQRTDMPWSVIHRMARSSFLWAIQPWNPHEVLWTVDVEMCFLVKLWETFIWTPMLVTLMNLPSEAEVTLGLPVLCWSSSKLVPSNCLMVFPPADTWRIFLNLLTFS